MKLGNNCYLCKGLRGRPGNFGLRPQHSVVDEKQRGRPMRG